ncbi:hypothetical protein GCM10009628_13060 [Paeniglutamicibacter kerguelensis]
MLYVVTDKVPARERVDEMDAALKGSFGDDEMLFGVGVLPYEAGMRLRIMGDDPTILAKTNTMAWAVAQQCQANAVAPLIRKS